MSETVEQPVEQLDSDAASNSAAEDNTEAAGQADDQNLDADSQEQPVEEDEEIEIGDKKVALPKSLAAVVKSERMMQKDYTQKTQAVAEQVKAVEAREAKTRQNEQEAQHYLDDITEVKMIEKQLALYKDLDWDSLIDANPGEALKYQQQQRALEAKHAEAVGKITTKQNERALSEQQEFAKRVQDAEAYIGREIKGVTPTRISEMEKYATDKGMDRKTYAKTLIEHPVFATFVHKAEMYDALMKKQAPKPQPAQAAQPAIRVVGSSATVTKDPAKMTDKEFAQWRGRQISQRK